MSTAAVPGNGDPAGGDDAGGSGGDDAGTDPAEPDGSGSSRASRERRGAHPTSSTGARPTAGTVLHRVLATNARAFLVNDLGEELTEDPDRYEPVDARTVGLRSLPVWALPADGSSSRMSGGADEMERVHQSRVALRRIRTNLRTFRVAMMPVWGTALRAEAAWYGRLLGHSRDLAVLERTITGRHADALHLDELERLLALVGQMRARSEEEITRVRGSARRFALTEQMMVLWDGPAFKPRAARPADEVLLPMLRGSWHHFRGSARAARKQPNDAHLHKLRIRTKDLRYGSETLALVDGPPASKTAAAAQRLQTKLGDIHDAELAISVFAAIGSDEPDLARATQALIAIEREMHDTALKGWWRQVKEVERRWRRWVS
ncbi:MAG: CHAD domain-containing protein [Acidimicrobiales bacterium]